VLLLLLVVPSAGVGACGSDQGLNSRCMCMLRSAWGQDARETQDSHHAMHAGVELHLLGQYTGGAKQLSYVYNARL